MRHLFEVLRSVNNNVDLLEDNSVVFPLKNINFFFFFLWRVIEKWLVPVNNFIAVRFSVS